MDPSAVATKVSANETSSMDKIDVFISYGHGDRRFVDRLSRDLRQNGLSVWIDRDEIRVGESLIERIRSGIDNARTFVVVVSRTSVNSPWVRQELDIAMHRQIQGRQLKVLPVLLGRIPEDELPSFLLGRRFADFRRVEARRAYRAAFADLVRTIAEDAAEGPGSGRHAVLRGRGWESAVHPLGSNVHKLMFSWTQLAFANAVGAYVGNRYVTAQVGVGAITVLFPIAAVLSRLLNRHRVASVLLGGLVGGFICGGLAYEFVVDWSARIGFMYGAFFGASLTSYFSTPGKPASLPWNTAVGLLFAVLLILDGCTGLRGLRLCWEMPGELGVSLGLAGWTLVYGLMLTPVMLVMINWMETAIPSLEKLYRQATVDGPGSDQQR
jgi:hypothetical protein